MKLRQHSIMRLIYACLLALPMFSVFGRVIYTQSNSKANESYSGTQQIYERVETNVPSNEPQSNSDIQQNYYYYVNCDNNDITNESYFDFKPTETTIIKIYDFTVAIIDDLGTDDLSNIPDLFYSVNSSGFTIVYESYDGSTWVYDRFEDCEFSISGDVILSSFNGDSNDFYLLFHESSLRIVSYELQSISTLDNAFDYSLSKFVSDNDFGKLNLFQWFWSIFLTNNTQNMLYIHFVNWYMNYALLVSSAYILFLVLMWFINFSRRILERGMNYDW